MSDVTLSKAVRSNLLSLQNTANMMSQTQNRLATGNKVNSALDNPTNFFTASSLNSRAGDINQLMDNGLTAITKTLESMQSTLRQARQDKSFQVQSLSVDLGDGTLTGNETFSLSGGALGSASEIGLTKEVETTTPAARATATGDNNLASITVEDGDPAVTFDINGETVTLAGTTGSDTTFDAAAIAQAINDQIGEDAGVEASIVDGKLSLRSTETGEAAEINITGADATLLGFGADVAETGSDAETATETVARTVDELAFEINRDLAGQVRASNDNGKLRIENLSTQDLTITGVSSEGTIDGTSTSDTDIGGNSVRADMATQFRELRDQLDKLADDASFNGINLLRGDNLKITFNETGTSELDIRSKDEQGINSSVLKLATNLQAEDLDSDANIDKLLGDVKSAINDVRSQSSAFGSSLSIVENRQNFSKNMINTLQTGASNLTLADANEEAANLLALQTRQQLSSTALSMASQADQAVLRLF
jgi:flagellin-like hook-associated protein FlgL